MTYIDKGKTPLCSGEFKGGPLTVSAIKLFAADFFQLVTRVHPRVRWRLESSSYKKTSSDMYEKKSSEPWRRLQLTARVNTTATAVTWVIPDTL